MLPLPVEIYVDHFFLDQSSIWCNIQMLIILCQPQICLGIEPSVN